MVRSEGETGIDPKQNVRVSNVADRAAPTLALPAIASLIRVVVEALEEGDVKTASATAKAIELLVVTLSGTSQGQSVPTPD